MKRRTGWIAGWAFGAALTLSACGGGSDAPAADTPPAATDEVPPSASASAKGWKDFLMNLVALAMDEKEPMDPGSVTPPASEDSEPEPVL